MKSRIYLVLDDSQEFKVAFYGCNFIDMFYNGCEGFKRLLYKKNPNRPEPAKADYPVVHETFNITGDSYEEIYAEWMRQMLVYSQASNLLPVRADSIKLEDNSVSIQITFRRAMRRDKPNVPLKRVTFEPAKLQRHKTGYSITITFDV